MKFPDGDFPIKIIRNKSDYITGYYKIIKK